MKSRAQAHCRIYRLIAAQQVDLLSVMDHTPGQGQFKSDQSYADYLVKVYKHTPQSALALIEEKKRFERRRSEIYQIDGWGQSTVLSCQSR